MPGDLVADSLDVMTNDQPTPAKPAPPNWALGLPIGIAIGISLGVAMDNLAVGIALGMALAVGFGYAFKKKEPESPDKED